MQPLDVVCSQPFKHYHQQAMDRALRLGVYDFNRIDFIAAFTTMRNQTFKISTIKTSFFETGLVPYNPEKVLGPLRENLRKRKPRTPSPASSDTLQTWPTPQNPPELREYAQELCKTIELVENSPSLRR